MSITSTIPGNGAVEFAALCEALIEKGYHWLYPEVSRHRSTEWIAVIYDHHEDEQQKHGRLGYGQAVTMDEACALCVADYHERKKIETRKEELLKEPMVQEAFNLFNVKVKPKE